MDDVEGARMPLPGHDGANPAGVTPTSDHAQVAGVELDGVLDLAGGDVHLDAVVHLDDGVGVADGPPVGGVQVGDGVGAGLGLPDLAQLVLGLLGGDPVHGEPPLHVVDDAEVLSGLLDLDDIHESGGEPGQRVKINNILAWGLKPTETYLGSVRVLPSILMSLCFRMVSTSLAHRAYFRRFLHEC